MIHGWPGWLCLIAMTGLLCFLNDRMYVHYRSDRARRRKPECQCSRRHPGQR